MKKWLKILSVIGIFAIMSVGIYLLLNSFGLANIHTIKLLIKQSKGCGLLIFFLVATLSPILLCFVPLLGSGLSILGINLFGIIPTFFLMIASNILSTIILFLIGDKLGEGLAKKLVGQKAFEQAQNPINHKSKVLLPLLFMIPIFPHEALTIVAGMTKLKYWYIALVNFLHVLVETSIVCFIGSGIISWASLSTFDWIILINVLIIDISYLFKLEKKIK